MGHSSLDFQLRESGIMQSNVIKLLQHLQFTLSECIAVVSGARLPFEQQVRPDNVSDDDLTDESEDEEKPGATKELSMRLESIGDIINSLYRLSFKIRNPDLRFKSLKPRLYREVDPETNTDLFSQFEIHDQQHVIDLILDLRKDRVPPEGFNDYMVPRLAAALTLRRRYFKYWEKHSQKLAAGLQLDVSNLVSSPAESLNKVAVEREQNPTRPSQLDAENKTLLSGTEASKYNSALDEMTEKGTVVSYASTAIDSEGGVLEFPAPPAEAVAGKDFLCPFCFVLCPAKRGKGKAWKAHVLRDLQPYICTYESCPQPDQLFNSRQLWVEHENIFHRRVWRCHEHPVLLYHSPESLVAHLHREHTDSMTERQIEGLVDICVTSLVDDRPVCPICLATGGSFDDDSFENHLAHHQERIALFALPRSITVDDDSTDQRDRAI
ncbi:hypothetical protein VTN96DRAFT_7582 [Rasamsonia emersonii]